MGTSCPMGPVSDVMGPSDHYDRLQAERIVYSQLRSRLVSSGSVMSYIVVSCRIFFIEDTGTFVISGAMT